MFWGYDTWKNRKTHCNFLRVQIGRSADRLAVLNLLSEPWFKSNGRSSMFFGRTNFTSILTVPAPRLENRKVILSFRQQCHTPLGKEGASPPTDGGGVEPNKFGPNPNSLSCLLFISGGAAIPLSYFILYRVCTRLCTSCASIFSAGGRAQYVGLSW